jgi:hypothetical protein
MPKTETIERTYRTYWITPRDDDCPHCGPDWDGGEKLDWTTDDGGSVVNLQDGDFNWLAYCPGCDFTIEVPARKAYDGVPVRLRKLHWATGKPSYLY